MKPPTAVRIVLAILLLPLWLTLGAIAACMAISVLLARAVMYVLAEEDTDPKAAWNWGVGL